ncbi:hypothetical protein IMSAGC011_00582 [Lachnospiraceae bacterium]|nr:hypothetical protein IMSAGC011_00582 [Lachnospiraceae bacterium]
MNRILRNKKTILIVTALTSATCFSGCNKASDEEKALAVFSTSISEFATYIKDTDEKINDLDPSQKESVIELLEILDDMDNQFENFSLVEPPLQYAGVSNLARQASTDMSLAVSYYHTAYESEPFDENYANAAYQCYSNSIEYIRYIGYLLKGEKIPENDHVTVYEELNNENILDKWWSGDDENEATFDNASEVAN